MDMKKGRYFQLSSLFEVKTTKGLDKNKVEFEEAAPYDFIGRTSAEWGVQGKVNWQGYEANPKECFSLVQVGETVALWREKEWYASQNLFILIPRLSQIKNTFLYFQSVINKEMTKYGKDYNNYPTLKSLIDTKIFLPIRTIFIPDFSLMSEIYAGGGIGMSKIDTSAWREFKLDDLFEKINIGKICGKANDFPTEPMGDYTIPLLTAGIENQGLARYAKPKQCPTVLKNAISISANGANTGATFYHDEEFAVLQDAYAIKLKNMEIPDKQTGLFLASCIGKVLHGNFSWTYKAGWERVKYLSIKLPVKKTEEIDWEFMEDYIKAIQKIVIKDVVKYKDEVIAKTKEIAA